MRPEMSEDNRVHFLSWDEAEFIEFLSVAPKMDEWEEQARHFKVVRDGLRLEL
jgi:hypothetical protein